MNKKLTELKEMAQKLMGEDGLDELTNAIDLAEKVVTYVDEVDARPAAFQVARKVQECITNRPHFWGGPEGIHDLPLFDRETLEQEIRHQVGLAILAERGGA